MRRGLLGLAALAAAIGPAAAADLTGAAESISAESLLKHVQILSSEKFEGRAPGTKGEAQTIEYLTEQFRKLGLQPGNPDKTYVQEVPLSGFKSRGTAIFRTASAALPMSVPDDAIVVSRRLVPETTVSSSAVVFVGYGVVAPEFDWDDFKDADVRGKTLLMLVNDPQLPDPRNPNRLDDRKFGGAAMTYYGRWTYKYEIAAERGAAAAVVIHETGTAGYPFEVLKAGYEHESFDVQSSDKNSGRAAVEAWVSSSTARRLFAAAGMDYDALKRQALSKDFKPVDVPMTADFAVKNDLRTVSSRNVLARIDGSDPKLKDEWVVYSAHWDHLGASSATGSTRTYAGAVDNASGVAGLLELAKAFEKLSPAPRRSVLFLSPTAEETGLLGTKYYVEHPFYRMSKTLGVLNLDCINVWGRTRDIVFIGFGQSTLDDAVVLAARRKDRIVMPDLEPEKGLFYRSDHFEFVKKGVPGLRYAAGADFVGKPKDWGLKKRAQYTSEDYHKPSDVVKADWDLSGAVEDLRLLFEAGWRIAQADALPEWKQGAEFKARRDFTLESR
ncbi:MAG: M28 family peptidase [Elusimicrobia bacterium]|nr:M28 family peptidase [Elusimicrobiota bacterium]